MNIYYIDASKEITEYTIERFCDLFNGENCNFNAKTGESDEPLVAMPNDAGFIYTNRSKALKKCKELIKDQVEEDKAAIIDFNKHPHLI